MFMMCVSGGRVAYALRFVPHALGRVWVSVLGWWVGWWAVVSAWTQGWVGLPFWLRFWNRFPGNGKCSSIHEGPGMARKWQCFEDLPFPAPVRTRLICHSRLPFRPPGPFRCHSRLPFRAPGPLRCHSRLPFPAVVGLFCHSSFPLPGYTHRSQFLQRAC